MTNTKAHFLILLSLLLLTACDGGVYSGTLIFEGDHHYGAETALPGDVFMRAGTAVFEEGATISGSVYMLGGELRINGPVGGTVVLVDGTLDLGPAADVGGDLRVAGGTILQAETAVVRGQTMQSSALNLPTEALNRRRGWDDVVRLLSAALLLAGWAALLIHRRPQPLHTVGDAMAGHPLPTGAMGLLILLVLPALLVIMAFTIVLIPLVFVLGLLIFLLYSYGLAALGAMIGITLGRLLPRPFAPPALAFGGTLLLFGLLAMPFLGELFALVTVIFVSGSLLLTRFGTRAFTPDQPRSAGANLASYRRPIS